MSATPHKLVIAAIDFANPAPLMWDFEHPPLRDELLERYAIISSTPSECAQRLHDGTADIGLVPVAAYPSLPGAAIIPGCAIASLDHVKSILLVVKRNVGVRGAKRVALDTASLTSAAYTKIFFSKLWKISPEFIPHPPDLEAMLRVADAALLIGDPALLALKNRDAPGAPEPALSEAEGLDSETWDEKKTGESLDYIDLAHEWRAWTGTPWVSAFWAVREAALGPNTVTRAQPGPPRTGLRTWGGQIVEDFQQSRDHGLAHIDDLAREWSARIPLSIGELRNYLTHNIYYFLDDACLAGLDLFYRYAAECGSLPEIPKLRFL